MKRYTLAACAAAMLCSAPWAWAGELVVQRWGGEGSFAHAGTMKASDDGKIAFDLSAMPAGAKVVRARLYAFRQPIPNNVDDALVDIEIVVEGDNKPLPLVGPWFDCFDVPPAAVTGKKTLALAVKSFPGWIPEKTFLEIAHEGAPDAKLPAVKGIQAVHEAGQTFLTWQETAKLIDDDKPTWAKLRAALEKAEQDRATRYRIYASDKPITADNLAEAAMLAEVGPLTGYNVNGRSPDEAFHIMRQRMLVDVEYARNVGRNYYAIPQSAYDEVVVERFMIPKGKEPLANGVGLYVHHPAKTGKSYYAVTVIDKGHENTASFAAGENLVGPVEEGVGAGGLVYQVGMDMKVLFDYPGRREHYVQWTAPPLSNLPNQYYNWGVFVPAQVATPAPLELVLTGNGMYRRPRWPHRLDTIILNPHDAPLTTWYYGYPESTGTLRGLKQGTIQPYTWRRMLSAVEWMAAKYARPSDTTLLVDRNRIIVSGDRGYAATGALHFGMRNPQVFSMVYSCKGMPNPVALPLTLKGGDNRSRPTPAGDLERLIGKKEWALKNEAGQNIWDFFNLTAEVAATPKVLRPVLCHGGRGGWDWPPIADLFKALADTHNLVLSRGEWGELDPPGIKNPGQGQYGLMVRLDRPLMVFSRCGSDYQGGRNGDGGSTNMGVWWDDAGAKESATSFEVALTGGATADVTPRRLKEFKCAPGETVQFRASGGARDGKPTDRTGQVQADDAGLVTIPQVAVGGRTQLVLTRIAK